MNPTAYPLSWPIGQPRTEPGDRRLGAFAVSHGAALKDLLRELTRMQATSIVLSTNRPIVRGNLPAAQGIRAEDPGVALYFDRVAPNGSTRSFTIACDQFSTVQANIRAVGLTVASIRAISRYGATALAEQAFAGFLALPAKGESGQ